MHRFVLAVLVLVSSLRPGSASATLDSFLSSVNVQAAADLPGFHAKVSASSASLCRRSSGARDGGDSRRPPSWSSNWGRWPTGPRDRRADLPDAQGQRVGVIAKNSGSSRASRSSTPSRTGTSCMALLRRSSAGQGKGKGRGHNK